MLTHEALSQRNSVASRIVGVVRSLRMASFTNSTVIVLMILLLTGFFLARSSHHKAIAIPLSQKAPSPLFLSDVKDEAIIPQWRILGPFTYLQDQPARDPEPTGIDRDFLAEFGLNENTATDGSITEICTARNDICGTYDAHGTVIPFASIFPDVRNSIVYASAVIECPSDMTLALELGNSEGVSVRVNGVELIHVLKSQAGGTATKFLHMLAINLRKGNNYLVIKSDSGDGSEGQWALIASLMSIESAQESALKKAYGYLISDRLLKNGEKITLTGVCPFCAKVPAQVSIADLSGKVVFAQDYPEGFPITIGTEHFVEGYYTLTVQIRAQSAQDEFYVGDPERIIKLMEGRQEATSPLSQEHIQRDPIIRRYRILTSNQYYHPLQADWQRKVLLVLRDAELEEHEPVDALWTRRTGMHFRAYISRIDNTLQYYLLYVPVDNHGAMPLVIDMPYEHLPERPFLESSLAIGWPTALDMVKRSADNAGTIVAMVYGRGNVGDAPIGEADVFEALNDILGNYSIDRRRIYLYGNCEGGRRALLFAEHYPSVFAAVGSYDPKLDDDTNSTVWNWLERHGNVRTHLDGLAHTPVSIFQGEFDHPESIGELQMFFKSLKRVSPSSELHIVPDGLHGYNESIVTLFPWFDQIRNGVASPPIAESAEKALDKIVHH